MHQPDFSEELARLGPVLRSLTYRFTYDREESADLVQDTLLRALTYRHKFVRNTNLQGWLFTMMRNIYINKFRKQKHEMLVQNPSAGQLVQVPENHTFNKPDSQMQLSEIWTLVNQVSEDLKVPFKMHATGYKYEEISRHLQIPIGTVKNRIFHARKEIQKKLHGYR